jgi:hypothetical protein
MRRVALYHFSCGQSAGRDCTKIVQKGQFRNPLLFKPFPRIGNRKENSTTPFTSHRVQLRFPQPEMITKSEIEAKAREFEIHISLSGTMYLGGCYGPFIR